MNDDVYVEEGRGDQVKSAQEKRCRTARRGNSAEEKRYRTGSKGFVQDPIRKGTRTTSNIVAQDAILNNQAKALEALQVRQEAIVASEATRPPQAQQE